jgi:hypothetical protein
VDLDAQSAHHRGFHTSTVRLLSSARLARVQRRRRLVLGRCCDSLVGRVTTCDSARRRSATSRYGDGFSLPARARRPLVGAN